MTSRGIFVTTADKRLVALPAGGCGAPTCSPSWQAGLGADPTGPSAAGSVVYVGTSGGKVLAFDTSGCRASVCGPLATFDVGQPVASTPIVDDGHLLVINNEGHLRAFQQGA